LAKHPHCEVYIPLPKDAAKAMKEATATAAASAASAPKATSSKVRAKSNPRISNTKKVIENSFLL
jgi:hypothetical protein